MPGPRPAAIATTPDLDDRRAPIAVQPQSMDRVSSRSGILDLPGSGLHMPPEVLGEAESPKKEEMPQQRKSTLAQVNRRARKRSQRAVLATHSQAAVAAAAQGISKHLVGESSMVTLLTYDGIEVLFATSQDSVLGVCSRTHHLFQTLHLASDAPVVSLTSNSLSGLLVVAHQDGLIQTYRPVPSDENITAGLYLWKNSVNLDCKVFYQQDEVIRLADRRSAEPGLLVDISSSYDDKLLVAHKNQLAVFDTVLQMTSPRSRLLWTTVLPANVVTAKIAGDGQAIVAVLEDDQDQDGDCGARTFVHDLEDGSAIVNNSGKATLERTSSIGIVFKPGPFLKHSVPVTRLSFRGLGRTTSSIVDNQGNDLLLSYCESDSVVRIFNQNSWKQLMMWVAPPKSRVDWIRGSSAFSLGDLESEKKPKSSRANSRRPSVETEASGGINTGLRNSVGSGTPNTVAGAWIAEITFRGAFPALRLSRLSYIKRGNDDSQPAHFESVAAILPAGSIAANSVLDSDDMGISVQGIWPAWNPWLSEPTGSQATDSLSGSAMQFLGLSSVPPPQTPHFGDSYQGGTHSPPTELRITAAHGDLGNILIMEFPLWGDDDFGAMELGSPLRSVLSLSSAPGGISQEIEDTISFASMDYDSSRLCAQIDPGERSISLLWRRQGSQCLYSSHFLKEDSIIPKSMLESAELPAPLLVEDKSVIPIPISLPPLRLPSGTSSVNKESLSSIQWLPDASFDGPPLLLALTRSCTLMVFEIPPPRSVQEPAMPNFDPFNVSSHGSVDDSYDGDSNSDEDETPHRQEYEVSVTPHPDFGLGLRLESPTDGLPAIAGSFKKHPLNGGMLPAEKTGMIVLGDEVLSVNGVSLENMTFDDIIATVRHVGAEAGPGRPLVLRFRPATRSRKNSAVLNESFKPLDNVPSADSDTAINRRHLMSASPNLRKRVHRRNQSDGASLASMLVGSFGEAQQEFGRVIAVIRNVVSNVEGCDISSSFLVTPWGNGDDLPSPKHARGAALLLCGTRTHIFAKRLVLPRGADPENSRLVELGSLDLSAADDPAGPIRSIQLVPSAGEDRCFVVSDSKGLVLLVVLEICQNDPTRADLQASFRVHRVCTLKTDSNQYFVCPSSVSLFATYEKKLEDRYRNVITVWTARSDPSCRQITTNDAVQDEQFGMDYVPQEIEVLSSASSIVKITDLSFVKTGYLDYFPSMIVFLGSEVIVYQRRSSKLRWLPVVRIAYPTIPSSVSSLNNVFFGNLKPQDAFPHLLPMILAILPSFDEGCNLVSDWHPEALIAYLCTEDRGAKIALHGQVQKTLVLLSDLAENSSSFQNLLSVHSPLPVAPFKTIGLSSGELDTLRQNASSSRNASANSFVSFLSGQSDKPDMKRGKMERLMDLLEQPSNFKGRAPSAAKSHEFQLAMAIKSNNGEESNEKSLPPLLESFHPAEFRALWAITDLVRNAPNYGNLDTQGQLALTIFSIHKSLKNSPKDTALKTSASSPYNSNNMHSFFQRRKSSGNIHEKSKKPPQSASSGSVAALLSDYQGQLIEDIRQPGQKLTWETVRELRMPFWIRSDDKLRQIAEEVGQSLYRESRDILRAAIFFLAAGKVRTLRNLAAADSTESGKKFFKFLTSYDFSSQRGRSAAEKNAFSLLRKNKYDCAAAFFLLAEPPLLKSAIETVASKMEDLDLAFMLSRLIVRGRGNDLLGFGSHALAFSGVLGGGGGYADASTAYVSDGQKDKATFDRWTPDLSHDAKDLLCQRALPNAKDDNAFSALLHVWLSRHDEAWHWLSGFIECPDGIFSQFSTDVNAIRIHDATVAAKKSQDPTITMVNKFINFSSGPLLLKVMKAATRTRVASAMLVSSSLCKIGIELPALRYLIQNGTKDEFDQTNGSSLDATPKAKSSSDNVAMVSSTFSSSLPAIKTTSVTFNDSDVHHQETTAKGPGIIQSSIFDSFDVPAQPLKNLAVDKQVDNGGVTSSIFDDYEAPPKPKLQPTFRPDDMTSSIFDSFETSSAPPKQSVATQSSVMESSIFDSFEHCARATPSFKASQSDSSGILQSSNFDSFDSLSIIATKDVAPSIETKKESGSPLEPMRTLPLVWIEWQKELSLRFLGRRMLRELATIGSRFHIDIFKPAISPSGKWSSHCLPSNTSQVLQLHADGDEILREIRVCLRLLSEEFGYSLAMIVNEAISILTSPYNPQRVCFVVLLHLAMNQSDLAEDVVRRAAQSLMERCSTMAFVNDDIAFNRQSMRGLSLLLLKQTAAHLSWQLEVCLWLHRGGALVLSGLALNEAICAVRIGLLIASWNRDFQVLEAMMKQPPDCLMDNRGGRQLWTSLKIISNPPPLEKKTSGVGSGGWEFLVDCRRAEATEMLRPRPTGCFIIRPHPEDHGVFTLSFKTNLKPTVEAEDHDGQESNRDKTDEGGAKQVKQTSTKSVRRDDVVQHAIVRLSDSGFRCGSFGPFATLMKLLEAVSSSLPFDLRFDMPPTEGVIKEEGSKPSPNCALFRKLSLVDGKRLLAGPEIAGADETLMSMGKAEVSETMTYDKSSANFDTKAVEFSGRQKRFGLFLELLVLSEVRKQLSGVAAAKYDSHPGTEDSDVDDSVGSAADDLGEVGPEQEYVIAARTLRPLLTWCRMMEIGVMGQLAPQLDDGFSANTHLPLALNASETGIEISTGVASTGEDGGDAVIRRMIKPGSGVEFRTLRLGEGGESAMVVLFSKNEAVNWFLNNGVEISEDDALRRLDAMEKNRVIEPVDLKLLTPRNHKKPKQGQAPECDSSASQVYGKGVRYRLVDPWEVEPLESREAETRGASLGRHRFLAFGLGRVAASCEDVFRSLGGFHLLELWGAANGGVALTKAIATVHPPWERGSGGDLQLNNGTVAEPVAFDNSIRQHLYRNSLFRRLFLPQRFMALIQVELLDLKNLTSPGGSLSLTVYALLRLKRPRSTAPLTTKARTLDSVATHPAKLGKAIGPNAPASWGSLVRFRFPLPENTGHDGRSYDGDREALFKGPPSVLQLSVYEKKFMSDTLLGGADVTLEGLSSGGQLEEWVPLRTETHGINWFARIRLTLRFELMCLSDSPHDGVDNLAPSFGLKRIHQLCSTGGMQEDVRRSVSTPDLLSYFESMVY